MLAGTRPDIVRQLRGDQAPPGALGRPVAGAADQERAQADGEARNIDGPLFESLYEEIMR